MQNRIAIKYGILAGVGVVAYFLLFYFASIHLFFNPVVAWTSLVIYLAFMVKACADQRKTQDTFPFQDALRTAFLTFVIASAIYYTFNYLLYNVFDTELVEVQKEMIVAQMAKMAKQLHFNDLKDQVQDFSKRDFHVTIGNSLMALGQSLIGGFGLSAIVAVIMRR